MKFRFNGLAGATDDLKRKECHMNERTREDCLRLLRQSNPRQRSTTINSIEGYVEEDEIGFVREEMSFIEQDLTVRRITHNSSRLCSCNQLITAKNPLTGRCQHPGCRAFTCAGCVRVCRCGRVCCPRHATVYADQEIYCRRCRPLKWLKMFFDIGNGNERNET